MAVAKDGNKQMIHIAMDKEYKAKAEKIARDMGISLAALIRMALIEKVKRYEAGE